MFWTVGLFFLFVFFTLTGEIWLHGRPDYVHSRGTKKVFPLFKLQFICNRYNHAKKADLLTDPKQPAHSQTYNRDAIHGAASSTARSENHVDE